MRLIKNRIGVQVVASRPEYLGMLLESLRKQTINWWDLFLVIQDESIIQQYYIQSLLKRLDYEGHRIKIIGTKTEGIGALRNVALRACDTEIGVRIDDDSICEPDYLEQLYNVLMAESGNKVGAVGGAVPYINQEKKYLPPKPKYNEVTEHFIVKDDSIAFYNVGYGSYFPADTLRSTYMFYTETMRKVMFPTCFDKLAGFREETLPLIELRMMGYKHWFVPTAICWHFGAPSGGTREQWKAIGPNAVWDADEIFISKCMELKERYYGKEHIRGSNKKT